MSEYVNSNGRFDKLNPTVQMLGRWQPWHAGHTELFKRCFAITGQVCIMIRQVPEKREANSRVPGQDDNPFDILQVQDNIVKNLLLDFLCVNINIYIEVLVDFLLIF